MKNEKTRFNRWLLPAMGFVLLAAGCVPPGGTSATKIFVASEGSASLAIFDRLADGGALPLQTINESMPRGIFVDLTNREIFVAAGGGTGYAAVFDLAAQGDDEPLRTVTFFSDPVGIVVDIPNNNLYITAMDTIFVHGRTANGNATPLRTIAGLATGLDDVKGIALDNVNDRILVIDPIGKEIFVFDKSADGNVAPARTITGTMINPYGIAFDGVHGEIFVADEANTIIVYDSNASGNAVPLRTIMGVDTNLNVPRGIAVDTVHNEIFVANYLGDCITVYERTATGNAPPLRTITGASLDKASGIWIATQ